MIENFEIISSHEGANVFSPYYGNGTIIKIYDDRRDYPVVVKFNKFRKDINYTLSGELPHSGGDRSLYFNHIKENESLERFLQQESYPKEDFKYGDLVMVTNFRGYVKKVKVFKFYKEATSYLYGTTDGNSWKYCEPFDENKFKNQFN